MLPHIILKSSCGWRHYVAAKRRLVAPGIVMVQKSVIGAGAKCKNHDKLIDYTVRVSKSSVIVFQLVGSIFWCHDNKNWVISFIKRISKFFKLFFLFWIHLFGVLKIFTGNIFLKCYCVYKR